MGGEGEGVKGDDRKAPLSRPQTRNPCLTRENYIGIATYSIAKMGQGSYSLVSLSFPQQFLYFKPEPQGQGSLRPTRSDGFTRLGWRG